MEHETINNLNLIKNEVELKNSKVQIVAVTKTFSIEKIQPLINHGHLHYGENKIQEAIKKWDDIKKKNKNLKLHFIGKLQTNKVKFAFPLFDYIHSLDNLKLANKISSLQSKINFKPKIFIQVNIGEEQQKNGVSINELNSFLKECIDNLGLNIVGLMCIPPNDGKPIEYFKRMKKLNDDKKLNELSMGMSSDYLEAIDQGATYVRIGSKIFGERN